MHHLVVTVPKSMPCVLRVNILTFPIKFRINSTECPISVRFRSQVQSRFQISVTNLRFTFFFKKNRNVAKISILGDRYVIVEFFLVEERQEINKGADLNVNTRSSKKGRRSNKMSRCRMDAPIRRSEEEEKKNKMIAERAGRIAQKWRSRWAELKS